MGVKQLLFGTDVSGTAASVGLLLLRLGIGLSLAFAHGLGKLPPADMFVGGVEKLGFPAASAFAWMAALSEFLGGLFVALGLFTRPAALFAAITMGVAVFMVHGADPFDKKEMALLFLMAMATLVFTGAGRFSIDALILGTRRK